MSTRVDPKEGKLFWILENPLIPMAVSFSISFLKAVANEKI